MSMIFEYSIKRNKRSKRIKITIDPHKGVFVTLPFFLPDRAARLFVIQQHEWIEEKLNYFKKHGVPMKLKGSSREYFKYKELAREHISKRLDYFNQFYNFNYKKIAIRNQATRWGSCSSNKILNFHYKLVLLDPSLSDYVIVHELCHLQQMNHSKAFWNLVSATVPDYKAKRRLLRTQGVSVS